MKIKDLKKLIENLDDEVDVIAQNDDPVYDFDGSSMDSEPCNYEIQDCVFTKKRGLILIRGAEIVEPAKLPIITEYFDESFVVIQKALGNKNEIKSGWFAYQDKQDSKCVGPFESEAKAIEEYRKIVSENPQWIGELASQSELTEIKGFGWYWWDKENVTHGPYSDFESAKNDFDKYCIDLENSR